MSKKNRHKSAGHKFSIFNLLGYSKSDLEVIILWRNLKQDFKF